MDHDTLGIWLGSAGLIASIAGAVVSIIQIFKTKAAVQASHEATDLAIKSLASKVSSHELSNTRGLIKTIQESLKSNRFETASIYLQIIIEQMSALRERPGFQSQQNLQEIQTIIVNLSFVRDKIEVQITKPGEKIVNSTKAIKVLHELSCQITGWSETLRYSPEGRNDVTG